MKYRVAAALALALASPAAADTTPQTLPFSQDWSNTSLITTNDDWSGVPGIVGFLGQDTSTMTGGIDPRNVLTESTVANDISVLANQGAATSTQGDVGEFHLSPNPVVGLQGSGGADSPYLQITLNTTGITGGIRVRYNLRDIDGGNDDAAQAVALQYRVGTTGSFTNVPEAYVADATTVGTAVQVTPVNVVLPAAADNQPIVQIRIITGNAVGSDEWVGIDDISVTVARTNPTAIGGATPNSAERGDTVRLTALVTPGDVPASTGIVVTCDLTAIGGSATQVLLDDGQNDDAAAGDNIHTFSTTVGSGASVGAKTLPCTISDAELRSTSFDISFAVAPDCGDGVVEGSETCDDGGTTDGNGCSATCTVEPGYTCAGAPSSCSDIDECADNIDDCSPNATCDNAPGSYACTCNAGYEGSGMGANGCADIDECTLNSDDCVAAASCANTPGSFTCGCPTGYAGDGRTSGTGCTDVDECTQGSDDCVAEASCANSAGGFTCSCASGYTGDGRASGTGCADTNECGANTDTCDTNATCTNTSGGFACACNTGYSGDGMSCADVDECTAGTDNCGANAVCTNTAGGFSCACAPGFSGDGVTCTEDADPDPSDPDGGGCCSSSTQPGGVALLAMLVIAGLRRRQRS